MSERYDFVFTLSGYPMNGAEFRLRTSAYGTTGSGSGLPMAASNLAEFARRILNIDMTDLAVRKIQLKSAWLTDIMNKKRRVTARELMEAMVQKGLLLPKGRSDERIKGKPPPQGASFGREKSKPTQPRRPRR